MGGSDYKDYGDHTVMKVTDNAVAIDSGDTDEKGRPIFIWFPKSVVSESEGMEEGVDYTFEVERWFLEKEGLV